MKVRNSIQKYEMFHLSKQSSILYGIMMKPVHPEYEIIQGKTYSLFGESRNTDGYYRLIRDLANQVLELEPDMEVVIQTIIDNSSKKRLLKRIIKGNETNGLVSGLLNLITPELQKFTLQAEEHLRQLSYWKLLWDRRLATSREQYHLYMLEIELTNRKNSETFRKADRKIALLPHCLRDLEVNCKAAKNGFDRQCRHCSKKCFQNAASNLLERHNIEPYIWMGGDFKNLARETIKAGKTFGVLGIACIPELTMGMRRCRKYHLPVVGMPLNANRCIRWFGEFRPNSVNLEQLEELL
jgi:hypothetical protein